jgi:hypothetical protein
MVSALIWCRNFKQDFISGHLMATGFLMELEDKMLKYAGVFAVLFTMSVSAQAKHESDYPLSPEDWQKIMEKVFLLEDTGLMPTLLPVIMGNRDMLQLTDDQIDAFRTWRKKNYTNVISIMNRILEKKVRFRVEALSPETSEARLLILQSDIQELQRELLKLKMSCRKLVMTTFTDEQWVNFAFVVSDNPRLSGLLSHLHKDTLD